MSSDLAEEIAALKIGDGTPTPHQKSSLAAPLERTSALKASNPSKTRHSASKTAPSPKIHGKAKKIVDSKSSSTKEDDQRGRFGGRAEKGRVVDVDVSRRLIGHALGMRMPKTLVPETPKNDNVDGRRTASQNEGKSKRTGSPNEMKKR